MCSVSCWTIVGRLAILAAAAGATPTPGIAAKVSLDTELSDAEHRVWIAHQQWLVAGSGPGVNRVNRLNPQPPIDNEVRKQLQEAAWRSLDGAKTVVDELRARLAGSEAPLDAVADLEQRVGALPGRITIGWSPVPGALTYTVEINVIGRGTGGDWSLWRYVEGLDATDYTFDLGSSHFKGRTYLSRWPSPGPARWRVWAVDAHGLGGPIGEWSELVPPDRR